MTAVVAGIAGAFVTRLAPRAHKAGELRRLPGATVVELNESRFSALVKPGVLTNCAGAVCVEVGQRESHRDARRCRVIRTPSALFLAYDGTADVAVLVSGPESKGAV